MIQKDVVARGEHEPIVSAPRIMSSQYTRKTRGERMIAAIIFFGNLSITLFSSSSSSSMCVEQRTTTTAPPPPPPPPPPIPPFKQQQQSKNEKCVCVVCMYICI